MKRLRFPVVLFSLVALAAMASPAFARDHTVPEIDPGSISSALALLFGGLLMLSGRRRSS